MQAELVGGGRVDQVAGIGGAHLEEDAVVELAQGMTVQRAVDGDGGVGPGDDVHADRRAVAQDLAELLAGVRRLRFVGRAEAEAILAFAQGTVTL